jgi:hypothetical protein
VETAVGICDASVARRLEANEYLRDRLTIFCVDDPACH